MSYVIVIEGHLNEIQTTKGTSNSEIQGKSFVNAEVQQNEQEIILESSARTSHQSNMIPIFLFQLVEVFILPLFIIYTVCVQ